MRTGFGQSAAAAVVAMIGAGSAGAQLVVGHDSPAGQIAVLDFSGPNSRTVLTGADAQVSALAADQGAGVLYWLDGGTRLMRAPMVTVGTLSPTFVGNVTVSGVTAVFGGLAFDSVERRLYGWRNSGTTGTEGFYEISTTTGAATLVYATANAAWDFGGFDFDAGTNAFYGLSDSGGAGIYRISKPLASPTIVLLAPYPGTETDLDGLAAGNGRLYLVNDDNSGTFVYNLTSGAYEAPVPFTYATTGAAFAGGAWAPGMVVPPSGSDMMITLADAPDPLVLPPGGNITYTVTLRNNGPEPASGITASATLPPGVALVSLGSPATEAGGVVTAPYAGLGAGQTASFTIVVTPAAVGSVSLTATVASTSTDTVTSNNAATAQTLVREPQADLRAGVAGPADCAVGVGGTAVFSATAQNFGPEPAEAVTLTVTLPEGAAFVSSDPPLTPVNNQIVLEAGGLAGGGVASVAVTLSAMQSGPLAVSATAATATADPLPANNSAARTVRIAGSAPGAAAIRGVLSTLASSPTSQVPGAAGLRFVAAGIGLGPPRKSESGERWIMQAQTDGPVTSNAVLITGSDAGVTLAAREGVLPILPTQQLTDVAGPPYYPFGDFDGAQGINDAGQFAFSGIDSRADTVDDGYIVLWNGAQFVLVAQETLAAPGAGGGVFWGGSRGGVGLGADGAVSFFHTLSGPGVSFVTDAGLFAGSGAAMPARKGVTIPLGQVSGGLSAYDGFDPGGPPGRGYLAGAGPAWLVTGSLAGSGSVNRVTVVDNVVVLQEGAPVPGQPALGSAAAGEPVVFAAMDSGGWTVAGRTTAGTEFVLHDGALAARQGQPIVGSGTETWGANGATAQFLFGAGNRAGDVAVCGLTSAADALANTAVVLNGARVVARENDPVDLDGDGAFDDNVYIRAFADSKAFLTDDGELLAVVSLRDGNAALCGGADNEVAQALVRIPTAVVDLVTCDYNSDGGGDNADVVSLADDIASGARSYPPATPDFNQDGGADNTDVIDMAGAIASGTCP